MSGHTPGPPEDFGPKRLHDEYSVLDDAEAALAEARRIAREDMHGYAYGGVEAVLSYCGQLDRVAALCHGLSIAWQDRVSDTGAGGGPT